MHGAKLRLLEAERGDRRPDTTTFTAADSLHRIAH
jgi:hypothetical protein